MGIKKSKENGSATILWLAAGPSGRPRWRNGPKWYPKRPFEPSERPRGEMVQNGTKSDNLDRLGGPGGEMVQNGT